MEKHLPGLHKALAFGFQYYMEKKKNSRDSEAFD